MKTKLVSMLLACIMLVSLAACTNDNDKPGSTPEESTKETDVQTTEDVTTEEDTTEPTAELALNEDLLSDIGLTYSELVEKRGEKVDVYGYGGGIGYCLENGYGTYMWGYDDLDYGRELDEREGAPVPRDENHNIIVEKVQLPKSDIKCTSITFVKAKYLLLNVSYPLNVSDIESLESMENFHTAKDGIATSFNYATSFLYKKIEIRIYHNNLETIDTDSVVEIFLRIN